ncbi:retrovirus-related pol polyprotein from transposon TNT 1-94 [Tanacetum coccineum]
MLLTGIGDEIYSTVDACKTTHETWIAIKRLQQGESLNIQDVKTNLFKEFGKFTSHDGESMESYYFRFYRMMNEMIRNNLTVATMQVNVQFLQQLQPEWSRIAKNANLLALVAAAQPHPDPYYQAPKSHKPYAPTSKQSSSTRSNASTKFKGKEIAKPITPLSKSASDEDSDLEQAQKDKDMQKNLALIEKYFKKLYKPTNNNLRTSLNSKNKNVDTSSRYKNDHQTRQFGNQRIVTIAGARETVGSQEVPTANSGTDTEPLEQVQYDPEYNVLANDIHHSKQHASISNTCVVEKVDSNFIPDSLDMYYNDIQTDQNVVECDDKRVALANLIANLKLDVDENKKIQKQIKKANTLLAHELKECKFILVETSKTLGESNSIRDSCLIALQNKDIELETYKTLNDRIVDYDKLEHKLNEALGLLAQKEIDIKEGLVKEKTKVITDLKLKEEKDIDKMISMEYQLKFLNEIVYKRNQSIQTVHMLAPKGPTFNGRPTFANPMYLKKAQSKKPCLYEIPYDTSDLVNRFVPDKEETLTLEQESRSKLNKGLVKPYDYTNQNSLYEIFKPTSQEYHVQFAHENEVRKKMWRKSFVKTKPHIVKNIGFLPTLKSISKSRQAYNVMTNNINHFRELVDQAWEKHSHASFCAPTALDMEVLIKTCLMPLALKIQNDSFIFVHELKQEMHDDLKYVESLKKEIDKLESEKDEFSNMYDLLLQECVSKDVMCSYFHSLSDLHAHIELQCLYLHKVKECECLAQKLSKKPETERKQYHKIQDLKAQLQDKNIAISELKKLIEKTKGKSVETKFDKPSVVRKPNAQKIQKPLVLGKPTTFSDSLKRKSFPKVKLVPKTNVSKDLSKPVSTQILFQTAKEAIVQLILFIVDSGCTKHMTGNLKLLCNFVEKYLGLNHNLFSVGQFCDADLEVAFQKSTCFVSDLHGNDLLTASPTQAWLWHRRLSYLNFDYINLLSKKDIVIGLPKLKYVKDQLCYSCEVSKAKRSSFKTKVVPSSKGWLNLLHMDLCGLMRVASINGKKHILASDYDNSGPVPQLQNVSPSADVTPLTQQELDLLFGPLYDEFFTAGNSSVNKSSSPINNSKQQDTPPTTNIQSLTEPTILTITVTAEENNTDNQAEIQVDNGHVDDNEFYNVLSTPVREEAKQSSRYVDPSNMHTFYQPHQSEHRWAKDHPLSQVRRNPSKPVQTR